MRRSYLSLFALVAVSACDRTRPVSIQVDAGPACELPERLVNGQCRFICKRDGDCAAGQRCNLLSATCEPRPPEPDASVFVPCTEGARRCSVDSRSVERCGADGRFSVEATCPSPDGFCSNERCLTCRPTATKCAANPAVLEVCEPDGSGFRTVPCAGSATCQMGECRECTAQDRRCAPDGKAVQECQRRPQLNLSTTWVNVGDNFDGTCITQQCAGAGMTAACVTPQCIPGSTQCMSSAIQQTCSTTGQWESTTCTQVPGLGPTAECQNGACIDECADAVRERSYFGCEYWAAVMDNVNSASVFKGGVTSGQGAVTQPSEYAFVITNRSSLPATVTVRRWFNNAVQTLPTVTVPGRLDPTTRGLAVIRVPWQSIGTNADARSTSGLRRYAYKLVSSRPISVYQFNPLAAFQQRGACSTAAQCTEDSRPACVNGTCRYYSYTNDASLLLPAHIFGTSYVGLASEHIVVRQGRNDPSGAAQTQFNGQLVIVAKEPNTQVTVRSTARTLAGAGVAALTPGQSQTFTLNDYDVLQLASDTPPNLPASANLECGQNRFEIGNTDCSYASNCSTSLLCGITSPCCCTTQLCRIDNDLSGSVITSDKPIAVFGGSACTTRGFTDVACDHLEEQLFPFVTWGRNFVASRTAPLRLANNTFASSASAGPDFYKIVAGCPTSQCPNGTLLTLTPPPAAGDVLSPNRCLTGTLAANTCRLAGGGFVEFRSRTSFTITADQPIQVAQLFASQSATAGTGPQAPIQGDPSLVLLPPIEQWRSQYTVLTAPGIRDNYLGLVIDSSRVQEVRVNGTAVPQTSFTAIGATPFRGANVPVPVGTHTILVVPRPGQMTLPGAGVTVYGFDEYVSYGYTGGLDLTTIVTG
ncbi:MAG: IgGFc-binding protein, partial [Myxococcaceae bacterium]|nr:IgGFc-binding protein [Myxococcaceae bacterium]